LPGLESFFGIFRGDELLEVFLIGGRKGGKEGGKERGKVIGREGRKQEGGQQSVQRRKTEYGSVLTEVYRVLHA